MTASDKWRLKHVNEGIFNLKRVPGLGFCMVSGCRKQHGEYKLGLCHKHYQHRWRNLSRKPSAFATLRDHAKSRGLEFNLTYDYFLGITDCAGFWDLQAESRGEWATLDRVDGTKGYVMGNIRVITQSHNTAKSNRERHLPAHIQSIIERKRAKARENPHLIEESEPDGCPF